jgi:uncharacterized protein
MKSAVYRVPVACSDTIESVQQKIALLADKSKVLLPIVKGDLVSVKIHFGEEDNTGFVKPAYAGVICRHILQRDAVPSLSDANTLYKGRRTNSRDHRQIAMEHGFLDPITAAGLDIPDDSDPENTVEVHVGAPHVKTALIAAPFMRSQALVGVSHFKGHLLTGFAGAIKNIGMGCATRKGKLAQHSDIAPFVVTKKCNACLSCVQVCPVKAITVNDGKTLIDSQKCIGCASCLASCRQYAIDIDWEGGGKRAPRKIVEYAKAVLDGKKGKVAFFNFATHITAECDCLAKDDPSIVSDVGILASSDPVAIDKASYDLVVKTAGRDVFKEAHPKRDGVAQLEYAASLKLGSLDYDLIEV